MDAVTSISSSSSEPTAAPPPAVRHGVLDHALHPRWGAALLVLLVAFPLAAEALDESFYIGLGSRILIYALAATSLNLILGFGGLVSFGHAAFLGIGGYAVGILMQSGVSSAWVSWPLAVVAAAAFSFVIAAISLRTRGVYFIMITLAFAQMLYYVMISLRDYGGEDGLPLPSRSSVGRPRTRAWSIRGARRR